ncbi:unnamed protein product [Periconia digitata]|uniref:Uncharacterized protein n=1 Tax=Periconia digitata TaxID=1303443 RepID=A0A9W4U566_9PLEO|nr:unnamed protein product [Periconia digitata]
MCHLFKPDPCLTCIYEHDRFIWHSDWLSSGSGCETVFNPASYIVLKKLPHNCQRSSGVRKTYYTCQITALENRNTSRYFRPMRPPRRRLSIDGPLLPFLALEGSFSFTIVDQAIAKFDLPPRFTAWVYRLGLPPGSRPCFVNRYLTKPKPPSPQWISTLLSHMIRNVDKHRHQTGAQGRCHSPHARSWRPVLYGNLL